jgi:hypothetical protein
MCRIKREEFEEIKKTIDCIYDRLSVHQNLLDEASAPFWKIQNMMAHLSAFMNEAT